MPKNRILCRNCNNKMHSILRWSIIVYYLTHIPITLCLDLQALLQPLYPATLRNLYFWYISTYNDPLMSAQPFWFKSFIFYEIFQIPYFFVAAHAMFYRKNYIRIPSIIYGCHVTTTVSAILSELVFSTKITHNEKLVLFSFYFPYLLFPAVILFYFTLYSDPFGDSGSEKKTKSR